MYKKEINYTWVKCPKCKGTGINPCSLMIEPAHKRICSKCKGTGWILKNKGG